MEEHLSRSERLFCIKCGLEKPSDHWITWEPLCTINKKEKEVGGTTSDSKKYCNCEELQAE